MKKGKILTGIFGFLPIFMLGGAIHVNAAETDFAECVKQDECVLESDVTIDTTIELQNDLVLDLNGYTITSNVKTNGAAIETSHTLTIKDSKGTGLFDASQGYAFFAFDGGTLILDSGEIKAFDAPFTGNNTNGDMNAIVNGGTLTAIHGAAIYSPSQGKIEINGGTLNGGINIRMGQVTINGGNIINNNPLNVDPIEDYYGFQGSVWLSDAIAVIGGTYTSENAQYGNSLNLVINGGNIESELGNALTIYAFGKVEQDLNLEINGGTFNGKEISVAIEDADSLGLKDYSNVKVEDYKIYDNNVNVSITSGTFNSNVESLPNDGYKVVETDGLYNVEPNLVLSTDDESVTFESEKPLPNDYELRVEEKTLADVDAVISDAKNMITESLKENNTNIAFKDSEVLATYDINVYNGTEIVKIEGTDKYRISIAVAEDLLSKYDYVKVAYINDEGKVETIYDATYEDGIVSFETTHLSTYSIIGYNADLTQIDVVENPSTGDNALTYIVLGGISLVGIAIASLYLKKKNN